MDTSIGGMLSRFITFSKPDADLLRAFIREARACNC